MTVGLTRERIHVVDATVWMRDARQFAEMNEVYGAIAGPHPPARTTVRIPPNSGESLIEIMMLTVLLYTSEREAVL